MGRLANWRRFKVESIESEFDANVVWEELVGASVVGEIVLHKAELKVKGRSGA